MKRLAGLIRAFHEDEQGHLELGLPSFIAGAGAIALGIGAASDSDVACIAGGVVLGIGISAASLIRHRLIDADIWQRLEKIEK